MTQLSPSNPTGTAVRFDPHHATAIPISGFIIDVDCIHAFGQSHTRVKIQPFQHLACAPPLPPRWLCLDTGTLSLLTPPVLHPYDAVRYLACPKGTIGHGTIISTSTEKAIIRLDEGETEIIPLDAIIACEVAS
ncbi:MAG: hypothetical protein ACPG7F_00580 [Aggregatilineales bacterium]